VSRKSEDLEISNRSIIEKINECHMLERALGQQGDKYIEMERNMVEAVGKLARAEIQVEQISAKLEDRENKFYDLEESFNKLTVDHGDVTEELAALKIDHNEMLQTNSNLLVEIRELTQTKESLTDQKEVLESTVADLLQDIRDLKEAHQIVRYASFIL
jgi:chromosome segregation ATPase